MTDTSELAATPKTLSKVYIAVMECGGAVCEVLVRRDCAAVLILKFFIVDIVDTRP
jgi:hypothetical protein